jgi:hypothetical protein
LLSTAPQPSTALVPILSGRTARWAIRAKQRYGRTAWRWSAASGFVGAVLLASLPFDFVFVPCTAATWRCNQAVFWLRLVLGLTTAFAAVLLFTLGIGVRRAAKKHARWTDSIRAPLERLDPFRRDDFLRRWAAPDVALTRGRAIASILEAALGVALFLVLLGSFLSLDWPRSVGAGIKLHPGFLLATLLVAGGLVPPLRRRRKEVLQAVLTLDTACRKELGTQPAPIEPTRDSAGPSFRPWVGSSSASAKRQEKI